MRIIIICLFLIITFNLQAAESKPTIESLEIQIIELRKANLELYRQVLELSWEKNQRLLEEATEVFNKRKAQEDKKAKEIIK